MYPHAPLQRTLGPVTRALAGLLALGSVWAVLCAFGPQPVAWQHLADLPWLTLLTALLTLRGGYIFARGALTGVDQVPVVADFFSPAPEPATDAQLDRLRWLGTKLPRRLTNPQAERMIGAIESRLPATPAQQLALARYGSPRGVFTRASAERYLRHKAAEELFDRQHDWVADWYEAGVQIRAPELLDPELMDAFDAAYAELSRRGLRYPLPAYIWSWQLGEEVERLKIAVSFLEDVGILQAQLVADSVLRRELDSTEIRQLFPAYAILLSKVGDGYMVELGEYLAEVRTLFLATLHAERPALLLNHAQGWQAAAEVRREIEAEAELRAADAAIEWDEDEDEE
jgi:hypothetical protein